MDFNEKPSVARSYCPGCEPHADGLREILDVQWCETHMPARDGLDDALVAAQGALSGSAEAGGDENRRWCEVIHRGGPRRRRNTRGGRIRRLAS